MRAVIFSDIHLGKTRFNAQEGGRNVREADVERAFFAAVEQTIALDPDLILIPGDIVDHVRVSMYAVRAWKEGVRRMVGETSAHLVAIGGNHDIPRNGATLSPIVIPSDYKRAHIVLEPQRLLLRLRDESLASIACFPFMVRQEERIHTLDVDEEADHNILLIHAAVRTSDTESEQLPTFYSGENAIDVGYEAERFDIVAAGDFHTYRRLHATRLACYPGSLERVSSNIWDEPEPKGIVVVDTETQVMEFVPIETRKMVDLPALYGVTLEDLNLRLEAFAADEELKDAIVRLKVEEFPKEQRLHIDWKSVRALKDRCLHFEFDVRYAVVEGEELGATTSEGARAMSLAEEWAEFTKNDAEEVRLMGATYMGGDAVAVLGGEV